MQSSANPLVKTLVDWIEIQSVTGSEKDYADALGRHLEGIGFDVETQEVSPERYNVLARTGRPEVIFCTHIDTVPPWFGSKVDADFVHGRGACDAKGPAIAMITAAAELLGAGESRIGMLFTVGEEIDSIGAKLANDLLAEPWTPRYTIVGEPTGNRFVAGHKGIVKGHLCARGVAGHSSQDVGPSAVHELCHAISGLVGREWGDHSVLGTGTINFGKIEGGVAPNVVADAARSTLLLRSVEPVEVSLAKIREKLGEHVEFQTDFKNYPPVEFLVPPGQEGMPVAFGTDAPHMPRWGQPLLYGPGHILDAHTDHERVEKSSLERSVVDYRDTARWLLEREDASQ